MKKLILALVALGFAFAISSCCDQSYCPGNRKCQQGNCQFRNCQDQKQYRWGQDEDQQIEPGTQQERQHRRW